MEVLSTFPGSAIDKMGIWLCLLLAISVQCTSTS